MSVPEIKEYLNGRIFYDPDSQQIFCEKSNGHCQLILDLRGWGAIQNMFKLDRDKSAEFQDKVGEFIAEAIREKYQREFGDNK